MKYFLITGGAGFIASNYLHYVVDKYPENEDDIEVKVLENTIYDVTNSTLGKAAANSIPVRFIF